MNITASRALARRQAWKRARRHWQLYLFLLLPVAYLILFSYVPMVGAQIAFRDYSPVRGIWGSAWAGLKYFEKFIDSYQFERVLTNTLRVSLYSILAGFRFPWRWRLCSIACAAYAGKKCLRTFCICRTLFPLW